MKNQNLLFTLFFLFFIHVSILSQKKDRTKDLRDSITLSMHYLEFDSSSMGYFFDSVITACKISKIFFIGGKTASSHFLWPQRHILIDTANEGSFLEKFISEITHAEQFRDHPFFYSKLAIKSFWKTTLRSVFKREKYYVLAKEKMDSLGWSRFKAFWWATYQDEYEDPNSIEFEHYPRLREARIWDRVARALTRKSQKLVLLGSGN